MSEHVPLGVVAGGTICCPCHGSRYSIRDGSIVSPPAPPPLSPRQITVSEGTIHIPA